MFDFENYDQSNDSVEIEESEGLIERALDALEEFVEGFFGINDDKEEAGKEQPDDIYSFLDTLDVDKYVYEKEILPDGVTKETISWETTSETEQEATEVYDYNLEEAADVWHLQQYSDSCAITCQEFILEEYSGREIEEDELVEVALENGWVVEGGTSFDDIGNILEYYGIETYRTFEASYDDLENALNGGDRVIVAVYNLGLDNDYDGMYYEWSANHAIEVVGIDKSNPEDIKVIVNDPGVEDGCCKSIDYDVFMNAWATSSNYMMVADRP